MSSARAASWPALRHALEGIAAVELDLGVARLGAEDVEVVHEALGVGWLACCSCVLPENLVQMRARAIADRTQSSRLRYPARQSDVRGPPSPLTGSTAGNGTRAMRAIISGVGAARHKSAALIRRIGADHEKIAASPRRGNGPVPAGSTATSPALTVTSCPPGPPSTSARGRRQSPAPHGRWSDSDERDRRRCAIAPASRCAGTAPRRSRPDRLPPAGTAPR